MKIKIKRPREVSKMRDAGQLVAECFAILKENIRPGVTLQELDDRVERYLRRRGAKPLYKGYKGSSAEHPPFPGVICASVNSEICHGIPDGRTLQEGDIVGIDIGLRYHGWCGDACVTFPVGEIPDETVRLLEIGRECLKRGIEVAQPGNYLNTIGSAIEDLVFTIEPMINVGSYKWMMLDDGWTVITADGSLSAQFEHTVAITENGTEILTSP
jgi:methionyl aminopeptidase